MEEIRNDQKRIDCYGTKQGADMTDLKARAREIAEDLTTNFWDNDGLSPFEIQLALLKFAREVLLAEPSEAMMDKGYKTTLLINLQLNGMKPDEIYNAMSAELAKELE
jgi:hypothetical protein